MSLVYSFICDHCGERLDRPNNQLPRSWVTVSISSPIISARSEHWCQPCQQDLVRRPSTAGPLQKRRIKHTSEQEEQELVDTSWIGSEDVVPIDERGEEI